MRSASWRLVAFLGISLALWGLTGCPLPYDFSGEGAGDSVSSDPSSPGITAPVLATYSESGGPSGTIPEGPTGHIAGNDTTVTLSTATENAVIYYRLDGNDITDFGSGAVQRISDSSGSFTINRTTGVETRDIVAVAVGSGMLPSPPVSRSVTVSAFPVVTVTADDTTINEDGGSTIFQIRLSQAAATDLAIPLSTGPVAGDPQFGNRYEASDISMNSPDDSGFSGNPGTIPPGTPLTATIPAGETAFRYAFLSEGDPTEYENDVFTLTADAPVAGAGYVVGSPGSGSVEIIDSRTPIVTVAVDSGSMSDNGGTNTIRVISSIAPASDLTVNLSTSGSYESADVTGIPGPAGSFSITIPAGDTVATRSVTANPDLGEFNNEAVAVSVTADAAYGLGSPTTASFSITDTSPIPVITLTVDRTNMADTQIATFTLSANVAPEVDTVINLDSVGISPFWLTSALYSSFTLPAGDTSAQFVLNPNQSNFFAPRTGTYTVDPGTGYQVGTPSSQTVTITDTSLGSFEYVGYWGFNGDFESPVGAQATATTEGAAWIGATSVDIRADANTNYDEVQMPVHVGTSLPSLNKDDFMLALRFQLRSFRSPGTVGNSDRAIIVGGVSYRWIRLITDGSGNLTMLVNGSGGFSEALTNLNTISANSWYVAVIYVSEANGRIEIYLTADNGVSWRSDTVTLPSPFEWVVEGALGPNSDEVILSSDRSNLTEFDGFYDWVLVTNGAVSLNGVIDLVADDPALQ